MHAFFSCQAQTKKRGWKPIVLFALFLLISTVLIYNLQIMPLLFPLAKSATVSMVTLSLQNAVGEASAAFSGKNLVKLTFGSDGTVVSLETDAAAIASISASLVRNIGDALEAKRQTHIKFPIGNLSGIAMLMGRGPILSVPIAISPQISCTVENEFYESGINQTLHRIVAHVKADAYILLPLSAKKVPIETTVCLAETVLLGKVPDAYTKINRFTEEITESEIDDIYDFGAQAN